MKKCEQNKELQEDLAKQMDIVEMIKWFRVFKFVTMLTIRKNQAQMVKYFSEYSLDQSPEGKIEHFDVDAADIRVDDLLKDFSPYEDETDRTLHYLITGHNLSDVMKNWVDDSFETNADIDIDPGQGRGGRPGYRGVAPEDNSIQGKTETFL